MSSTRTPTKTELREIDWPEARALTRAGAPLLDVRSPGEFAKGAAVRARSLPLLDDAERHEVGLTYKQVGRLEATQRGIELFGAKAERFLADAYGLIAGAREPLVHCWRGGMRSRSVALYLQTTGLRPFVVRGGYKAYRNFVLAALADFATKDLLVLDGRTGAGKSELVRGFEPAFPAVDFEAIARHRGSAFGDFAQAEPVPPQQSFENQLADRYLDVAHAPRLLVEIENFIGPIVLPQALRDRIFSAPTVLVERDFDDRVERLAAEYAAGWTEAQDALFLKRCEMLRRHVSKDDLQKIVDTVLRRDFRTATALLLTLRYDKVYDKGIAKRAANVVAKFNLTHEYEACVRWLRESVSRSA